MHKHKSVGKNMPASSGKDNKPLQGKGEDASEGKPLSMLQDFVREKLKNEDESEEKSM